MLVLSTFELWFNQPTIEYPSSSLADFVICACADPFESFIDDDDDDGDGDTDNCGIVMPATNTTQCASILHSYIKWRRWEQALERLDQFPQEASIWIMEEQDRRLLPLHLVCSETTRQYELVEKLVCTYPEAIRLKDQDGRLPLHLFCLGVSETFFCSSLNIASIENSLQLLSFPEAWEEKDVFGNTPMSILTNAVNGRRTALTDTIVEALAYYNKCYQKEHNTGLVNNILELEQ
mmetsp:Transcript_3825/g.5689  ORF Transcript_3825/g.5689 Transcript_3825/m.5689 type:complete len:235 (+) Transcript_3825:72-776(+)